MSEPGKDTKFKIESLDDLKRIMTIARGGDPDAIQAISNFMNFKSNIERSYFPDKTITVCVAQLEGYGRTYFPDDPLNPFSLIADSLAIANMAYKGFKSNQFVDMTRQTPNLADLQTSMGIEEGKASLWNRISGRSKTE